MILVLVSVLGALFMMLLVMLVVMVLSLDHANVMLIQTRTRTQTVIQDAGPPRALQSMRSSLWMCTQAMSRVIRRPRCLSLLSRCPPCQHLARLPRRHHLHL